MIGLTAVERWLAAQEPLTVFTTTVALAEILYGVELLPMGARRTRLSTAMNRIFSEEFESRILTFDEQAARLFAKIVAARRAVGSPIAQSDAMIAAIARSREATVATRNIADFEGCGARLCNPWRD